MKIYYIFFIYIITLNFSFNVSSSNVFDSDFFDLEVNTSNAKEAKENSINHVKNISFIKLINKILNNQSRKKFNRVFPKWLINKKTGLVFQVGDIEK